MKSLSQFQALQDGEKELASLRELGLNDTEIQLWQSRDAAEKVKQRTKRRLQTAEAGFVLWFGVFPHHKTCCESIIQLCQRLFGKSVQNLFFFGRPG